MKLARKRFLPETLLALSFVMSVIFATLCYWHVGRLLELRSREDSQVSVSAIAIIATVFAALPASVYIRHKLGKAHNRELKDADGSATQLSLQRG